ncbi:MAG: type IX secretion system outer membrane channel protein PorV [Bacteroidales bacterium]|nr:type IX secretion system outer membrane channel protein PorV [Bacteroidales bacterium]
MANKSLLAVLLVAGACATVKAQDNNTNLAGQTGANYIYTGIPILLVAPDAVSSAMGDVGAASTPDANSAHWNNAKFAFVKDKMSLTTTYTPWLRNLSVSDMNFLYLAGYYKINQRSAAAASLTYFSLGKIQHTGDAGEDYGDFRPNELAFDVTYAMKLSDNLSLGATGRYLRSDLTNGLDIGTATTKAAGALSADVGLYYEGHVDAKQNFAVGAFVSNLGNKLRYSDDDMQSEFLPANLRIGGRYSFEYNEYNKINVMLDVNKLLVPTPPTSDSTVNQYYNSWSDYRTTGSIAGVFHSFHDAPGGIAEELKEISLALGTEYWYANTFALRAGYFFEHADKGGRQYFTVGAGIRYKTFNLDLSYLVPTNKFSNNPLTNTLRIQLTWNLAENKK